MLWLNRLRQRLSLTKNEALALLSLSSLLVVGLAARHIQQNSVTVPVGAYDEMDRLFFERSALPDSTIDAAVGERGQEANASRFSDEAPGYGGASVPDDASPRVAQAAAAQVAPQDGRSARVDINTADAAALETLPRIGPKTAERILAHRSTYGPFLVVDDLQQIRGIGEKTVEMLRPLVYVGSDSLGE